MIELNADVGEGCDDASLVPLLKRVSIACGGHAGDDLSMVSALRLAAEYGVAAGAHPSYPDRTQFGRHALGASGADIMAWVTQQTETLAEHAARLGLRLIHVKPHGALYNVAARDADVARAVAQAVAALDPALVLVGLSGSCLIGAGQAAGLSVLNEAFADRRYHANGHLVSRETPGALLTDPEMAARQARAFANGEPVAALSGEALFIRADTLCLHGDSPGAIKVAQAVHATLYHR
jgi:UPF0271 protein